MQDLEAIISRTIGGNRARVRPGADSLEHLDGEILSEVLPDFLRASIGGANARNLHPLLPAIQRERLTLGELRQRSGVNSSDLSLAMNSALGLLLTARYVNLSGDIAKLCRNMPALDFRPQTNISLAIAEPAEVVENSETPQLKVSIAEGAAGELQTIGGRLNFGRRVWESYGRELVQGILAYADAFSAVEAQHLAATLEAATLTTASGTLNIAGLATAAAALRDSLNLAGSKSNLPAAYLLVPSSMETTARVLIESMGRWPTLVVSSYLTSNTTYYLFAQPNIAPKLLHHTLQGSSGPRVYSDFSDALKTQFAVFHDFGFSVASGPGIVKVSP
jgi:hypothetical protein